MDGNAGARRRQAIARHESAGRDAKGATRLPCESSPAQCCQRRDAAGVPDVDATDGAGNASFNVTLSGASPAGSVITSTATNLATGDTSEFSACVPVTTISVLADLNGDGLVNGIDLAMLLGAWTGAAMYAPCPPFKPADLNHDCRVNGLDLATLLAAWDP